MNNDSFKDLVRSKVKTTKQIAREAVEEAFDKKKRKRKGRGKRSNKDDDLSSSESENENESESRRQQQKKKTKHSRSMNDDGDDDYHQLQPTSVRNNQYRDRAKERREGKNKDYEESQKMLDAVTRHVNEGADGEKADGGRGSEEEISKYLGGDEAHTHLVKGLDVALARSVKNEIMEKKKKKEQGEGEEDGDDEGETVDEMVLANQKPIDSKDEAWQYIQKQLSSLDSDQQHQHQRQQQHTDLGRSVLNFFLHQERKKANNNTKAGGADVAEEEETMKGGVSAAGSAIQRTQLSFAVDWDPRNIALSWEVPREKSHAAATDNIHHRHGSSIIPKASPLPSNLIVQIIQKTTNNQRSTTNDNNKNNSPTTTSTKDNDDNNNNKQQAAAEEEDSDEDDIFPDAGD